MLAVYLLIGFFIGNHTSKMLKEKKEYNKKDIQEMVDYNQDAVYGPDQNSNNHRRNHKIKVRKKMKKYFSLKSNSPGGIDPEKISVNIKKKTPEKNKSSPKPNFIALTILWAHYVAKQLGLLKEEVTTPWNIAFSNEEGDILEKKTKLDISRDSWRNFLSNVIKDKSWTRWIKNPGEVKTRTLLAFQD